MQEKNIALILAAGQGKRMGSDVPKQYISIEGSPLLYYTLKAFCHPLIDGIVLVAPPGETSYCKEEIVERYGFSNVMSIVEGGSQRYHSVYNGIRAIEHCRHLFIHDGARPFVDGAILERASQAVEQYQACAVGMPVKDTIKIVDNDIFTVNTPRRDTLWLVQTPQVFDFPLIREAYEKLMSEHEDTINVTDDAMVVETMLHRQVKLVEGSYKNIKITTPEDLEIARLYLSPKFKKNKFFY